MGVGFGLLGNGNEAGRAEMAIGVEEEGVGGVSAGNRRGLGDAEV